MFQILGIFSGIEVSMVSGIYSVVAKVYAMMLDLAQNRELMNLDALEGLTQTCYVLAGVFMLFRTVVGLIQILVDPDKMSDGNVGAGKLISRVVISILLLLLLQPQGILFKNCESGNTCNEGGLLPRIEDALLASDGLINNMIEIGGGQQLSDKKSSLADSLVLNAKENMNNGNIKNAFIEDVYAADDDVIVCYYYKLKHYTTGVAGVSNRSIDEYYRLSFSKKKNNDGKTYTKIKNSDDWYFYSAGSNVRVGGGTYKDTSGDDLTYSKLDKLVVQDRKATNSGDYKNHYGRNSSFENCPVSIIPLDAGYTAMKGETPKFEAGVGIRYPSQWYPDGLYGGSKTLSGMFEHANKLMDAHDAVLGVSYHTNSSDIETPEERESNQEYLTDLGENRDAALQFARGAAASFHTCASGEENQEKCKEARDEMFGSKDGNDKLEEYIDDDILDIGFIISMVIGIALMIYLLILCVDVIVRRFKLTLLQVMAPIPAISYVDPKDKIFSQWSKMYIATYLDLFIKLIAIALALGLLNSVWGNKELEGHLLYRFFYIVAILVFAKLVPSMITKIFGLDSMGGSFKDILGMGKAAAGFGAGAVIGAAAGAATGKGLGRFTGLAKGAMMGAGSGAKGNITGGSQKIAAANKLENDGKASGLNFFQRKMAGATAALGIQDAYSKAKAKKQVNDDFVSKASAYEDEGLNKVNKVIGNGFGNKFKNLVEARNDAQQASVTGKASLLREVDNGDGTTSFVNKLTGDNYATYNTSDVTDDMRSHFLDADNYSMSAAEAQARVKGAEKQASKQLRDDLAKGNFKEYGFKENDADLAEMSSLKQAADSAAVRAGYRDGYTKDNKDAAKRISAEQGAIMDQNEAAHMYSERK